MVLLRILAAVLLLLPAASALAAGGLKTIVFEGRLVSDTGSPVGGVFPLRFSLHNNSTVPEDIWSEDLHVAVESGAYTVTLGDGKPLPTGIDLATLYLQVSLDGVQVQRVPVDVSWIPEYPTSGNAGGICKLCENSENSVNAQRLDGLSVKQLKRVVGMGIRPASTVRLTSSVGGGAGAAFKLECPPGHVVTGIQGVADAGINSLTLICRPLEGQ
jgi:hypothetical protein